MNPKEHCKTVALRSGKQFSGENVVNDEEDAEQKKIPNQSHEEPAEERSDQEEIEYKPPPIKPYVPPIPFPQRLK